MNLNFSVETENISTTSVEDLVTFWIEGVLTPIVSLVGIIGKKYH